jgi:hypothetical protein
MRPAERRRPQAKCGQPRKRSPTRRSPRRPIKRRKGLRSRTSAPNAPTSPVKRTHPNRTGAPPPKPLKPTEARFPRSPHPPTTTPRRARRQPNRQPRVKSAGPDPLRTPLQTGRGSSACPAHRHEAPAHRLKRGRARKNFARLRIRGTGDRGSTLLPWLAWRTRLKKAGGLASRLLGASSWQGVSLPSAGQSDCAASSVSPEAAAVRASSFCRIARGGRWKWSRSLTRPRFRSRR